MKNSTNKTKVDIFSGFLGAGKTTLIKKLVSQAYKGEKLVIIENEFGEIGIDGGFLQDAGIEITEMNSGCICCSLVGDFGKALEKVLNEYTPDRILIEPSGVGKLSDVIAAVKNLNNDKITLNSFVAVVNAGKCKMYMKNFGEFFNNQIENAACIVLSHTESTSDEKIAETIELIRKLNNEAPIISTPWEQLDGKLMLDTLEKRNTLANDLDKLMHEHEHCNCHHDHENEEHHCCDHDHGEDSGHCHHGHENKEHHHCCHHEHGEHSGHCHHDHENEEHHHCGHHEHGEHSDHCHHDHENEEHHHCCHHEHGEHNGHSHHHADEVFDSWGIETAKKYGEDEIKNILTHFEISDKTGVILRAKGIVNSGDCWLHFDYIPGKTDIRKGSACSSGRICVIGSKLDKEALLQLFNLNK